MRRSYTYIVRMKPDFKTVVTARIEVKAKRALIKAARERDISPSRLVARLIEKYLAEIEQQQAPPAEETIDAMR